MPQAEMVLTGRGRVGVPYTSGRGYDVENADEIAGELRRQNLQRRGQVARGAADVAARVRAGESEAFTREQQRKAEEDAKKAGMIQTAGTVGSGLQTAETLFPGAIKKGLGMLAGAGGAGTTVPALTTGAAEIATASGLPTLAGETAALTGTQLLPGAVGAGGVSALGAAMPWLLPVAAGGMLLSNPSARKSLRGLVKAPGEAISKIGKSISDIF